MERPRSLRLPADEGALDARQRTRVRVPFVMHDELQRPLAHGHLVVGKRAGSNEGQQKAALATR